MTTAGQPRGAGARAAIERALRQSAPVRATLLLGCAALAGLVAFTLLTLPLGDDLLVYWKGGWAVLHAKPLYGADFASYGGVRSALVFTYPPVAAVLFAPLALLTPRAAMVVWTAASVLVLTWLLADTFRQWWRGRTAAVGVFVLLGLLVLALGLQPVSAALRLGQIGILLTALCFADLVIAPPRRPRGVAIGLATAIKLTPGIFLVHLAVTRQWRALRNAVLTVAACWSAAALLLPAASAEYFGGLLLDTSRVGALTDPAHQSLNATVHRLGLTPERWWWVLVSAAAASAGLWRARRAHLRGNLRVAAVIAGLTMLLVSPFSWTHHAVWLVPLSGLLLTDARWGARVAGLLGVVYSTPLWQLTGLPPPGQGLFAEGFVVLYLAAVLWLPLDAGSGHFAAEAGDLPPGTGRRPERAGAA